MAQPPSSAVEARQVWRSPAEAFASDLLAVEAPLELRVEGQTLAVLMRSPGDDLDLAAGFMWTEGIIDGADDLLALAHVDAPGDPQGNTIDARLAAGLDPARFRRAERALVASSACGVCAAAALDHLAERGLGPVRPLTVAAPVLHGLLDSLRHAQPHFQLTGGMHGAALFDAQGTLYCAREDIGRHNAVDKVLGAALRADRDVRQLGLVVSSRAGYEITQKAWAAGVPLVVCAGAASTLALDVAIRAGMGLIGFASAKRLVRYA